MTHVANLFGGSSDSSADFDFRQYDALASRGGMLARRGATLASGTFNDGLEGFAPHFHNDTVTAPVSLTTRFPWRGKYACTLTTADETNPARATEFRAASTYKRLGWTPGARGIVSLSAMLALSGTASMTDWTNPIASAGMGIDAQTPEGTGRAFGMVALRPDPDGAGRMAWFLRTGRTSSTGGWRDPDWVKIPGTEGLYTGLNEEKRNYLYVRLTVNEGALASGGDYYLELQIGDRVFDLRGLTPVPWDLLLNAASWDHFSGGFNIGFLAAAVPGLRVRMLVGMYALTVGDTLA